MQPQPPTTKKPTKSEKLVITEALGEKICLLFVSVNLLKDEWVISLFGGVFIKIILHKMVFDGNVLCPWSQTGRFCSGDASIVVLKDFGFHNGVGLCKIKVRKHFSIEPTETHKITHPLSKCNAFSL